MDSLDDPEPSSHERRKLKREQRQEHSGQVARLQRRRQRLVQAAVGILIVAGIALGYFALARGGGGGARPAPAWQATSIDGERFSSQGLTGDVYAVDFFFTWCPICAAQLPHKKALVERFQENPDFHFLSVSADPSDSRGALDQYRRSHGASWAFAQDRDGLYQKFGVDSRPFIVFVDRGGNIVKTIRSLTEGDKLIRIVEPLLARPLSTEGNATATSSSSPTPSPTGNSTNSYELWAVESRRR